LIGRDDSQAGEVVWEYVKESELLRTYHKKDIMAEPDTDAREALIRYSYMLDHDVFGSTFDPEEDTSYFFNHSCDGNCWYDTDDYVVAMKDILPGEHIT
jgi:SET domain-containing protein